MTNSKQIGNNFERQFSRELSLWASDGKDDDLFWRDLSSGATATKRKKENKESKNDGDIVALTLRYKEFVDLFFIDTKSYAEFNPLIINQHNIKSNKIFHQWLKVCSDCPDSKIPLMVCNIRDRKTPQFIMMPDSVIINYDNKMTYNVIYEDIKYDFIVVMQEEFFNLNNYASFLVFNKISLKNE